MPMFIRQQEIEMRPVEKQNYFKPERMPPYKNTWIKNEGKLPDDMKNLVEGGYYIDKIEGGGFVLKRHSKGNLFSVNEKGFITEETE